MAEIKLKIASVVIGSGEGGGSGVAPYYADLPDKPSINGETLSGDMTSEDLGLASESQAVPSGGTTGQVLAKKSNADNDVQWAEPNSGGVIDTSLSLESENPVQNKAIKAALDGKVNTEPGKGLSANDFTTTLRNKLNAMPSISNFNEETNRITIGGKEYELTPYVPIPDYFIGFANSSTANFQAMTKEQLVALVGNGKTVDTNPSHSGTWDEYILFVLKRTNVSITSATFTSIAGGGEQSLELATMHNNITLDGITYNVVGKRLSAFNAGQDTFRINFSKQ